MGLNQLQSSESVRAQTFKAYMEIPANKTIFSKYKPMNRGYVSFLDHLGQFDIEAKNKLKSQAGTFTKYDLKRSIAKRLGIDLKLTKDYAIQSKNSAMKALVSFTESAIYKMNDAELLPFVNNLKAKVFTDALFNNADFIDYEVTSIEFAGIVTDTITFNGMTGEVKEDNNSSSTSNDKLDAIIDLIHLDFESMDNTVDKLAENNPDFVAGYYKNKVLAILGIRHEGATGVVRMNGVIQSGSIVEVVDGKKSAVANSDAIYRIYLMSGLHTLEARNAAGCKQRKTIEVLHRKMLDVDFDLAPPPPEDGI